MTATVTDRWGLPHFRKKTLEAVRRRVANAAFCDKSGDEMARGNVEGVVGRGAGVGGQLYVSEPAILSRPDIKVTSAVPRSSMGISRTPSSAVQSIVGEGSPT